MKTWLVNCWCDMQASYWFIPLAMSMGAILLAIGMLALDWEFHTKSIEWLFIIRPEGARAILVTIAGSMITIAGVTFSITVLAVSFSMKQIGPRLIQNFMKDRANQFTLGIFISTFLYSILILLTVVSPNESGKEAFTPHVSVVTAILLSIIAIGFFIFYIHHIPESINVFNLLAKISKKFQTQLDTLFPVKKNSEDNEQNVIILHDFFKEFHPVFSKKFGYIRDIDKETILKLAIKFDCMIEIKYQPGTFVTQTTPLMVVNKMLNQKQQDDLVENFVIGDEKSQDRNLQFFSDEIVEILAHALSPSNNAPFIAIAAMDWLQVMIESLSDRKIPDDCIYDEDQRIRLISHNLTIENFINDVFDKIRPYVTHDRITLLHTFNIIKMIVLYSKNKTLESILKLHAEKFFSSAKENLNTTEDKMDALASKAEIDRL